VRHWQTYIYPDRYSVNGLPEMH